MTNNQQALERLTAIENEAKELRRIFDATERSTSAEQWLINFLNENAKKWRVEMGQDRHIWYLRDQWIFDVDLKNKYFWCYYDRIWKVFYEQYKMEYDEVQDLIKAMVLKPFNYEGFTPNEDGSTSSGSVLKPFNYEGFTPELDMASATSSMLKPFNYKPQQ